MKVKELMIPVGEYKTVSVDATFGEVATTLIDSGHRDVLVVNDDGDLAGVLTMTDILGALEPNYKKLGKKDLDSDILSNRYVAELFKEFDLWADTLNKLCQQGGSTKASEAMYVPAEAEYLDEDDSLEQAIHRFITGAHQPLLVRSNGTIAGVLRLSDIFEEITKRMLACESE